MAYEQRDNSGTIFVNNKKEKETHPDRTGKAMIGGVMYWVSGWLKKSAKGEPFLSLAFKPVEEPKKEPTPETAYNPTFPTDGDEVPF